MVLRSRWSGDLLIFFFDNVSLGCVLSTFLPAWCSNSMLMFRFLLWWSIIELAMWLSLGWAYRLTITSLLKSSLLLRHGLCYWLLDYFFGHRAIHFFKHRLLYVACGWLHFIVLTRFAVLSSSLHFQRILCLNSWGSLLLLTLSICHELLRRIW